MKYCILSRRWRFEYFNNCISKAALDYSFLNNAWCNCNRRMRTASYFSLLSDKSVLVCSYHNYSIDNENVLKSYDMIYLV